MAKKTDDFELEELEDKESDTYVPDAVVAEVPDPVHESEDDSDNVYRPETMGPYRRD